MNTWSPTATRRRLNILTHFGFLQTVNVSSGGRFSVFVQTSTLMPVWKKTGWLVGINGARCTTELKKLVRRKFERPDDIQIFGFTADEQDRADLFKRNNPEIDARFPLIERSLTKADCHAVLDKHGIAPHAMYALGYRNANCLGCVKGGIGYWNKVRVDFPDVFDRMAQLERELDVAILKDRRGGVRKRLFLDELPHGTGRYEKEPSVECGLVCGSVYDETAATLSCDDDEE